MNSCRIRSGDLVSIISGDDKGKIGEVIKVLKQKNNRNEWSKIRVLVSGVKLVKKSVKPDKDHGYTEGYRMMESPIDISNVAIYKKFTRKSNSLKASDSETQKKNLPASVDSSDSESLDISAVDDSSLFNSNCSESLDKSVDQINDIDTIVDSADDKGEGKGD